MWCKCVIMYKHALRRRRRRSVYVDFNNNITYAVFNGGYSRRQTTMTWVRVGGGVSFRDK